MFKSFAFVVNNKELNIEEVLFEANVRILVVLVDDEGHRYISVFDPGSSLFMLNTISESCLYDFLTNKKTVQQIFLEGNMPMTISVSNYKPEEGHYIYKEGIDASILPKDESFEFDEEDELDEYIQKIKEAIKD